MNLDNNSRTPLSLPAPGQVEHWDDGRWPLADYRTDRALAALHVLSSDSISTLEKHPRRIYNHGKTISIVGQTTAVYLAKTSNYSLSTLPSSFFICTAPENTNSPASSMSPREDSTVMEAGAERSGSISAGDAMCLANVETHVAKDAVKGTESEKSMTLLQGLKTYPQAVAWSMLISTCVSPLCLKGKMERKIAD